MQDEVDDIRKSKSLLTKIKSMFRDTGQDASDIETLGAIEVTQKQLNLRMARSIIEIYYLHQKRNDTSSK